jgi:hypothetical protein
MLWFRSSLVVGCVLALASAAPANTYDVAQQRPQASDAAPGTADRPWKTIAHAAEIARPGDVVVIHAGVYREHVLAKTSGTAPAPILFEAAPGEQVLVSGADRLNGWRRTDAARPIYSVAWQHKFIAWNPSMTHPDDAYHRVIGRCEQVVVDGYLLRQVLDAGQIAPGAFFADVTNQTLLVWDIGGRDLNRTWVEASVRQEIFRVEGDFVQLRGLRFRYAANMAQHGAVVLAGHADAMEDCVVEKMNAGGATFTGEDAIVRRCVFRDNGQLGFGANGAHRLRFTDCVVENNNTKGFDRGWEAGGDKLVLCREAVLERSRFVRNRGSGLWFDIGNTNCTVRQCLIADNEDAGIFYEISFALHAHDNVIVGNGFAETAGAWGAQAGICLSSSPGCVIERNIIAANREGFDFREQTRTTPTIGDRASHPVWNHDELIRHNLISLNRDAQVWGWFDVQDHRHWPARDAPSNQAGSSVSPKPGDFAGAYAAKIQEGQPIGLTLEKLRLRFEGNVYFAAPGQGWFKWGPAWAHHRSYAGLREFQADLGIDTGSQMRELSFADLHALDLRLSPETRTLLKDSHPRGPVPGVALDLEGD